jgi:cell division protein FtsQ
MSKRKRAARVKRNQRRPGRTLRLFSLGLVLVSAALGVYLLKHSKVFELHEVVFVGNSHLSDADMLRLMGVRMGRNLLNISSEEMAEGLMSSPWVREASLRKEFMHRIRVMVVEAEPVALLRNEGGTYLVDSEGKVLEQLSEQTETFLPLIIVRRAGDYGEAYVEALSLAQVVKEAGLLERHGRVEIVGLENGVKALSIRVDGVEVRVGHGEYRKKLARYFELSDDIRRRRIDVEYVDVRFANRVVVKPLTEMMR